MKHAARARPSYPAALALLALPAWGCGRVPPPPPDARPDAPPGGAFCGLAAGGDVEGAVLPEGFCIRRFATVASPRVMAFAPNGDLFVSAPAEFAPGGGGGGPGAIFVLSDDDRDGAAESHTFAADIVDVHGLVVGGGFVYWTTRAGVFRTPYASGQRAETPGAREDLRAPEGFAVGGRWTHGLARSAGGALFASRGEYSSCGAPGTGEISQVEPGSFTRVAAGFRNPMYMRCHPRDEVCVAAELGEDQVTGAREKLLVVRPGTNYGYPCCHTANLAATPGASCEAVVAEDQSLPIGQTPFGLDWERGAWPAPFRDALFVALHGSFYSAPPWEGAGVVYVATDPVTHAPRGEVTQLVGGFGPGGSALERPADVAFAADGRLFFADDVGDAVYWVAPAGLAPAQ